MGKDGVLIFLSSTKSTVDNKEITQSSSSTHPTCPSFCRQLWFPTCTLFPSFFTTVLPPMFWYDCWENGKKSREVLDKRSQSEELPTTYRLHPVSLRSFMILSMLSFT